MDIFNKNRKAWVLVGLAVLAYLYTALNRGMTPEEWTIVVSTAVAALGAYVVPNMDTGIGRYAKTVVAFLVPALAVVTAQISGGLTPQEWIEAILTGAAAIGLTAGVGNPGYVFAVKRPTVGQAVGSGAVRPPDQSSEGYRGVID